MERLCTTAQYFNCEPEKGHEETEKESEELQNHTQCNEDRPEWLDEQRLKDLKCMW